MKDLFNRIQRELPDTDKDRYDAAYDRGQAQARSGLLAGGLAFGALLGAGLMFLFDPHRGAGRRAELASRATGLRNRAKGTAVEAGYQKPEEGVPAHSTARAAAPRRKAARTASNGTSVAGLPAADAQSAWEAAETEAQRASEGHSAG
jgi:hypothetical protein